MTFLAGNEVRKSTYSNNQYATRLGYNPTAGSFIPVNIKDWNSGLNKADMLFGSTTVYSLKNGAYNLRDNRFVSWYGNGSYEFDSRYLVSGSVRLDLTISSEQIRNTGINRYGRWEQPGNWLKRNSSPSPGSIV